MTENKDAEKKAFEERSAKLKKPDWEVPNWEEIASIKDNWTRLQRIKEVFQQNNDVSTVVGKHFKLQDELASMTSSKPKKVDTIDIRQQYKETLQAVARERREDVERQKAMLARLEGIEYNTATLQEINYHLQLNTAQQKEIFDLIVEILAIVKSSNQEEAKGKFEKVKEKINSLTSLKDSVETVQWLLTMANSAYIAYQSLPPIPHINS